jgi:hypothetical protein
MPCGTPPTRRRRLCCRVGNRSRQLERASACHRHLYRGCGGTRLLTKRFSYIAGAAGGERQRAPAFAAARMPKFFFHLTSSDETPDKIGVVLADLGAARCQAVNTIADVECGRSGRLWSVDPQSASHPSPENFPTPALPYYGTRRTTQVGHTIGAPASAITTSTFSGAWRSISSTFRNRARTLNSRPL